MKRGSLLGLLAILALVLVPGMVEAKKPPPPDPDPPPAADPAIAYLKTVTSKKTTVTQLMVMNADGSNQTVITSPVFAGGVSWSPDSTRLAFFSGDGQGNYGLYVINADGSDRTKVIDIAVPLSPPAWSPATSGETAGYIAYIDRPGPGTKGDVYLARADGQGDRIGLTDTPDDFETHPAWSRSGTLLAVKVEDYNNLGATNLWGLHDFAAGTYSRKSLAGLPSGAAIDKPSWAKDDEDRIAWEITYTSSSGTYVSDIWITDPDGVDDPVPLAETSDRHEGHPSWAPDDSLIVVRSRKLEGRRLGDPFVETVSVSNPSERTTLVENAVAPTWRR